MSENGLWVQEPPPAPDGLRRCLRCVNDDVLGELYEGWHSGEEYLCVPLVIHTARNNSVHHSAKAVSDWGEGALHAVVEEWGVCLIKHLLAHECHSVADRTEDNDIVVPAVDGLHLACLVVLAVLLLLDEDNR